MSSFRVRCRAPWLNLLGGLAFVACLSAAGPSRSLAQISAATSNAASPFPRPVHRNVVLDPVVRAVLQRIRRGEGTLSLQGEQITLLYTGRGRQPEQSEQTLYFDAARGYRCEYHAPDRIAGEVIVSRADGMWRYMPRRHLLVVGPPHPRRVGAQIMPALRAIRSGAAQALLMGQDTVAGNPADVVLIAQSSSPTLPAAKLWIDETTGLQLRTELYDADGRLRSVSYFTQVTYNPRFPANAFDPPATPAGTAVRQQRQLSMLSRVPTDAEAGFHVLTPANLPSGYVFQSASVFHYMGGRGQGVMLRYQNNLDALSLFERAVGKHAVRSPAAASPRAGTVIVRREGIELIAIGSLSNSDLLNVLNSAR